MSCRILPIATLAIGLSVSSASQAGFYLAPYGGYTIGSGGLAVDQADSSYGYYRDEQRQSNSLNSSAHWGVMLGYSRNDAADFYVLYNQQQSKLQQRYDGSNHTVVDLTVHYLQLGGTRYLTAGPLQPYIGGSLGFVHFSPDASADLNDRFAISIAGGMRYLFDKHLAAFAELRGIATYFDHDDDQACQWRQNCIWSMDQTLWQGQANLGVQLRF